MNSRLFSQLFLLLSFVFFGLAAHAQTPEDVLATVTPETPNTNQSVTIDLKSFSFDLGQTTIAWYLNNKLITKGKNVTSFTFTTGGEGSQSIITAVIQAKDSTITKQITVTPAAVDLLWYTDTYTPPFYKGKALYTPQSTVTLVGIPHLVTKNGTPIDNNSLVFTWKQNYTVKGSLSGYGKNTFSFKGNILSEATRIDLEVLAPTEKIRATASVTLNARNPEAVVYFDHPLYGILYNNAVTESTSTVDPEIKFTATPYYFTSDAQGVKDLHYNWTIVSLNQASPDRSIILRQEEGKTGTAALSLEISNVNNFFQKATKDFTINFTSNSSARSIGF